MSNTYLLKTDGGSRGNPGPSGIGFVLTRGGEAVCSGGSYIGEATNNVAEYHALIWGLENALERKVAVIKMQADSELLVKQIRGEYKVKNAELKLLFLRVNDLLHQFTSWTAGHIPREENAQADALANDAMNERGMVGNPAKPYIDIPDTPSRLVEEPPLEQIALAMANTDVSPTQSEGVYRLTIRDHFDAAHHLYDYPGECRNLHGHTWDIEVTVRGEQLDELGMVYDFKALKTDVAAVLADYDHTDLNSVAPFDKISPTAENLARVISERLQDIIDSRVKVEEVAVWESPIARLSYRSS